ncbi:MAG: hypothetical protein LH660_15420, partial [Phormidesmis sp. CAN_BIN36]|nr:hypothetical protein [Phormidesmis sp. CAN_BIN36]
MSSISRRKVLQFGLVASGAAFLPIARQRIAMASDQISGQMPIPYKLPFKCPPLSIPLKTGVSVSDPSFPTPYTATGTFNGTVEAIGVTTRDVHQIDIKRASVDILGNGQKTQIWGYNGIAPGPTIKVKKGVEALV